ncbi:unnamed protein product [Acanthoscelides obtectus]|uniref:Uncharacterized protein n=1 Tax=Acanthoscelides obtectus TaxID=200917 RepID=A0A9P0PLV2_ACAOB|nr:unnamed protein product [Acanthoscelides obtectus]CAK1620872.1 hypothetical protein AOBTE_LOCUS630 [Acanthoscelides obtectus]
MVQMFSFPSLCWLLHKSKIRKKLNCVDMLLQFRFLFIRRIVLLSLPTKFFDEQISTKPC